MFGCSGIWDTEYGWWLETGEVDKVDGFRLVQEVECENGYGEKRESECVDEIITIEKVKWGLFECLDKDGKDYGYEEKFWDMVDEILVGSFCRLEHCEEDKEDGEDL